MSSMSEVVDDLFQGLMRNNNPIYGSRPMPCDFDGQITAFVNTYMKANDIERQEIRSNIRAEFSDAFFVFSERMAALAVREQSEERVIKGLVALIIEDFRFDFRDNLRRLAPLYHSAEKIGINASRIFLEAASYGNNDVAKAIVGFQQRTANDRSLSAMGYREEYAPDGFRYVSTLTGP